MLVISAAGKDKSQKEIRVLIGQVDQSMAIEGDGLKLQTARKKYSMPGSKIEFTLAKGKLLYKGKDAGSLARIIRLRQSNGGRQKLSGLNPD